MAMSRIAKFPSDHGTATCQAGLHAPRHGADGGSLPRIPEPPRPRPRKPEAAPHRPPRGATRLAAPIRRPGRPPRPASLRPVGIRPGTDSDKPYPGIYSKPGHIPGAPVAREIEELQAELRRFAEERDWGHFHSPRSLAASLSIEAAEVLEHFQW